MKSSNLNRIVSMVHSNVKTNSTKKAKWRKNKEAQSERSGGKKRCALLSEWAHVQNSKWMALHRSSSLRPNYRAATKSL